MRLFVVLVFVALLLAGCGGGDVRSAPPASPRGTWDERWRDGRGNVVPDHTVSTYEAECVDEAVFLALGRPLGRRFDTVDEARQYVRDPEGTLETVGPLDTDARLPAGVRNTGYHLGDVQLWLGRDAQQAAYLVEGKTVERWPRLTEPVGCV